MIWFFLPFFRFLYLNVGKIPSADRFLPSEIAFLPMGLCFTWRQTHRCPPKATPQPEQAAFDGPRGAFHGVFSYSFCAIFTRNFFHKIRPSSPYFSHTPCGKLCGNCVKPCFSRIFSASFSKEAVENSVKGFLKNNFFMQLFLCFDQKSQSG